MSLIGRPRKGFSVVAYNEQKRRQVALEGLRPYCQKCGWRKGGPDSWNGVACKCGDTEPPMSAITSHQRQD